MSLKLDMTKQDIINYLTIDLKITIQNDILPQIKYKSHQPVTPSFVIPRLVLGYVDYLGALYHGYTGRTNNRGRRIFADPCYAKLFLKEVFGSFDPDYQRFGDLLWEMFRNGPIHLCEPLRLINGEKIINWLYYEGPKNTELSNVDSSSKSLQVTHLVPKNYPMGKWWLLPVSITCLYGDLLKAVDKYANRIGSDGELENKFRQVADALHTPESTKIKWW